METTSGASATQSAPVDAKKRSSALGKGIESLLGPRPQAKVEIAASAAAMEPAGRPLEIPLEKLERNPNQTRTVFDPAKLEELAASVRASGVVQPIVVRELPGGRFQLIAGERRWRASQIAGKATIPAIVVTVSDEQALEMTIVENLQRTDLNPMEQARAFERLGREFKMTQEKIALRTGKDRATIGNFVRMLKLPTMIQAMIESNELSFGHARALLGLDTERAMLTAVGKVRRLSMSVRQTELLVQEAMALETEGRPGKEQKAATRQAAQDPNVREAEDGLQRKLGLKVRIEDRSGKGRVVIEYSNVDDFDAILAALGVDS